MAKLTSKWWDSHKPVGFRCNLDTRLKDFERVVRKGNEADIFIVLGKLTTDVQDAEKLLRRRLKANPIKLKQMISEIQSLQILITKEYTTIVKYGSESIPVWSKKFGTVVNDKLKKKYKNLGELRISGGVVALKINLMTVRALEHSGSDARLIREANDIFDEEVDGFLQQIDGIVNKSKGLRPSDNSIQQIRHESASRIDALEKRLNSMAMNFAKRATAYHKDARNFKANRAFAVTTATLGVAGSAAGLAMPGTTALAVVGLIRSSAKLIEEIVNLMMTLEAKYRSVMAQIKLMQKSFNNGMRDGKETAKIAVNALIGADVMVTHKACINRVADFMGTLAVLADRVNKSQLKIDAAITKLGELDKILQWAVHDQKRFKASRTGKRIKTLEISLDKLLDKSFDTINRVVDAERKAPILQSELKKLGPSSKTVKVAEKVIPAVVNMGFALGSFGDGLAASLAAGNVAAVTLGVANDAASELTELLN